MGNCQAIDTATLIIQHPCGKEEKLYWPVNASDVMKANPGHCIALLISTSSCPPNHNNGDPANKNIPTSNPVRITRIKLLRATDTLLLGHVYRLITSQEVMKGMKAKKHAKMKKIHTGEIEETLEGRSVVYKGDQVTKHERQRTRTSSNSATSSRSKTWQPSLNSILETSS